MNMCYSDQNRSNQVYTDQTLCHSYALEPLKCPNGKLRHDRPLVVG